MGRRRAGSADLPLHGGYMPKWLSECMTRLGTVISEAIIRKYGRDELLRRLAHPFRFQAFGAVMGMDWQSSGITTSVLGALKRGLNPLSHELGIQICGGRGAHSRQTPHELIAIGERAGVEGWAKLGQSEEFAAIKRLDEQARRLERYVSGPSVAAFLDEERWRSHTYGGRSVFGIQLPPAGSPDGRAAE